jgi:hypothetical protein
LEAAPPDDVATEGLFVEVRLIVVANITLEPFDAA